jgi:uncharacterized membrane protein
VLSPTFLVELLGMARQMTSLPFLIAALALLADKNGLAWVSWRRTAVVLVCGMLAATSHYTMGIVLLFIMGIAILFGLVARLLKHGGMPLAKPTAVFMAIIILSLSYYSAVGQGVALYVVGAKIGPFIDPVLEAMSIDMTVTDTAPQPEGQPDVAPPSVAPPAPGESVLSHHERTMQLALGYGMRNESQVVRQWWEFQYLLEILVVVGAAWGLWQWWKRRLWSTQYMGIAAATMVIGALCVFMPSFSALLNATRFWLIILLFEAPLVVALLADVLRRETTVLFVFVPYFLFTSGIAFEVVQYDVSAVRIPYSIALSNDRIDLGASVTQDDLAARQFVIDNNLYPIFADFYGAMFLTERISEDDVYWGWPQPPAQVTSTIDSNDYVYLRSRNVDDGTWIDWTGPGTRSTTPIADMEFTEGRAVLFQCGGATILDKAVPDD